MLGRFSLLVVTTFVIFYVMTMESNATVVRERRDAPADNKNVSQAIDEALQSMKTGLEDLMKNIQSNELVQNVSDSLKQFGEKLQKEGKQIVDKIQKANAQPAN